uniref:Uncharacterized protein n=1 Tax=Tetranychus urticae TaxID=32264 RepID=T1KYU5_TETUR
MRAFKFVHLQRSTEVGLCIFLPLRFCNLAELG